MVNHGLPNKMWLTYISTTLQRTSAEEELLMESGMQQTFVILTIGPYWIQSIV